jgi:uncharacterized protein (TIGR02611 family)
MNEDKSKNENLHELAEEIIEDAEGAMEATLPLHLRMQSWARRRPITHIFWRLTILLIGFGCLAAGVAMLVLPGPGWAAIFLGLIILGSEFAWAHKLSLPLRRVFEWGIERAKLKANKENKRKLKIVISVLLVLVLALAIVLVPKIQSDAITVSDSATPNWVKDAVIYEVNVRQYTEDGTFDAFREHLPRLKELGVDILWLMPIYPISELNRKGTLGSYYSIANYKAVNPNFGNDADLHELIDAAHSLGFKVILDWVANHTGWDHPWITEHPDWYTQDENGDIVWPPGTDWTDVADLNYDNQNMRDAMVDAMSYWVEEFDIDGFRCDVAGAVSTGFWNDAREALNQLKPLFMLAEDSSNSLLLQSAFSANYGWKLQDQMRGLAVGDKRTFFFKTFYAWEKTKYPTGTFPMTFITNHDENSWNGTEYERYGKFVKSFSALYFTYTGIPLIYSGQEIGLKRRLAFFDKDEIIWTNSPMTAFYKKLISFKKSNRALDSFTGGELKGVTTNNDKVLVYKRQKGSNVVLTLINLRKTTQSVTITLNKPGKYLRFTDGAKVNLKSKFKITLKGAGFQLFARD